MSSQSNTALKWRSGGFSLVEIAIVLVVLGVLAQATLIPLSALNETRKERQLAHELELIRDALIAHLISYGEFPCPLARSRAHTGRGLLYRPESGSCHLRGWVPTASMALDIASDAGGAALDPWGRPYVYGLSDADNAARGAQGRADWSSAAEISAVGIADLRGTLTICRDNSDPCNATAVSANDLVFVVLSHGSDASASDLQSLNTRDSGDVFTLAPRSAVDGHRFDDALVWASRSEAVWWLLRAHRLP